MYQQMAGGLQIQEVPGFAVSARERKVGGTGACASPPFEPSVGVSPVHEIRCPTFVPWKMCLADANRPRCEDEGVRLLRPSVETLDEQFVDARTVPVEGRIRRRFLGVMCEH